MSNISIENHSPLGKRSNYIVHYDPTLLFPIPRLQKREEIKVPDILPFYGHDTWNAYEVSWLNLKGKPEVALAQFDIDCRSQNILESKSFKLYLNSFNSTKLSSSQELKNLLEKDIQKAVVGKVSVSIFELEDINYSIETFAGECLDSLDITCDTYQVYPQFLSIESRLVVEETLYSHLLKSNCLVTGQPDWGSVEIQYKGPKIARDGLLKYIVSFRDHHEFHEQCVERIFMDIKTYCQPLELTVKARYTRRGGLDINPIRSTEPIKNCGNIRMARQ